MIGLESGIVACTLAAGAANTHNHRMQKISSDISQPLHSVATTRQIEREAAATLPPHTMMQRAGLAVARLALALAPGASRIWIACGPGNNGGDGFEAALHLHQWGKEVIVTWTGLPTGKKQSPPDAQASRQRALAAGVALAAAPPQDFDLCIDALLGIGATLDPARPGTTLMQHWLDLMKASRAPCLAVDVPSGLNADSGVASAAVAIKSIANNGHNTWTRAIFTLSLLTLKPGLFTAGGRDCAGEVWFDPLGNDSQAIAFRAQPCAWLLGLDRANQPAKIQAGHASHKGSFGDVAVIGGQSSAAAATHMTGAALLAARAALHAGAGRVFVALLGTDGPRVDTTQAELMFRSPEALDLKTQVIVCGCGGGDAVRSVIARVLSAAARAVLDADALNAIAADTNLQSQLRARHGRGYSTVLTPHPLEAARLAGSTAATVQADRLAAAGQLAQRFQCVVVLKGSGSIVAAPGQTSRVNASGNALLATAGTGDVLAGMIGACLARGLNDFEAACCAVFAHGRRADTWAAGNPHRSLTASTLAMWRAG